MLILLVMLTIVTSTYEQEVLLQSKLGWIRGLRKFDNVDAFQGVRYAEKPDRLARSQVRKSWPGVMNATSYGPRCIAAKRPENPENFSEDCLLMNIFTPSNRSKTDSKLPVAIYIYGGGFEEGGIPEKMANGYMTRYVPRGIVVVTFQYRVGALGFLSLGCNSSVLPCNIGLWDQYTAFQFINTTIESFGGDPNNMTLWGHSAGAMSTSFHSHSPVTSKYFKKYIQLSASSYTLAAENRNNHEYSMKIIEDLNCNVTNVLKCIQNKSLDELYTAQIGRHLWPEIGDEIIPTNPIFLTNHTKDQYLLTGLQTLEALYFTYLKADPTEFKTIGRDTVLEYLNSSFAIHYGIDSVDALAELVEYFIPPGETSNDDYVYYMWRKTKIQSNSMFDVAVLKEIRQRLDYSNNIFAYHFEHFSQNEFSPDFPIKASYHCNEAPFVWGSYEDIEFELDEVDHIVEKFIVEAIVAFIKTGNPSTDIFTWPPTDKDLKHVRITPNQTIQYDLFENDVDFWNKMERTFNYDAITNLKYTPTSTSSKLNCIFLIIIMSITFNV